MQSSLLTVLKISNRLKIERVVLVKRAPAQAPAKERRIPPHA